MLFKNDQYLDRVEERYHIRSMCAFQIFVELITLGNELLLPLSEPLFFNLDLLGESLSKVLLLLLELGVVQFARSGFAELPGLHLLRTIRLVMSLFSGVNQIQHVRSNENRSKLLEVAVIFILNFGDSPGILSAFDNLDIFSILNLDILLATNDGEWHGGHEATGMLRRLLIIFLKWGLVDLDALRLDNIPDTRLETGQIGWGESVSLGDDWNQIDS